MEEFKTVNGVLTDYSGNKTEIVIPDGVKKIDCTFVLHSKSYKVRHMQGAMCLKRAPKLPSSLQGAPILARGLATGTYTRTVRFHCA